MKPTIPSSKKRNSRIYIGRSNTECNLLFFLRTIHMNYKNRGVVIICSLVRNKQLLCFVCGQGLNISMKMYHKELYRDL